MASNLVQENPAKGKKPGGLRSLDILVRHPVFYVVLIVICCLIFGLLAFFIRKQGALVQWDVAIVNRMHGTALSSPAWVKGIMLSGYYIGQHGFILISLLLALYFLSKRFWKEFWMVIFTCAGQGPLFLGLSYLFARPRPEFSENIGTVIHFYGFPSGHMISTVICFGLLAYFFAPILSSAFWKVMVVLTAVMIVVFVGFSRFFMGAHYLTDVVAGATVGIAWFCLVVLSIEHLSRKGDQKHVKQT